MAVIELIPTIVTQETHGVALDNVLRVRLHEFLRGLPQSGNRVHVLVKTQYETILFLFVGHELERIVINVAEQLDAGLDSPVPFVIQHRLLTEEETRFESAHVAIADRVPIDNPSLFHILTNLRRLVLINVVWE